MSPFDAQVHVIGYRSATQGMSWIEASRMSVGKGDPCEQYRDTVDASHLLKNRGRRSQARYDPTLSHLGELRPGGYGFYPRWRGGGADGLAPRTADAFVSRVPRTARRAAGSDAPVLADSGFSLWRGVGETIYPDRSGLFRPAGSRERLAKWMSCPIEEPHYPGKDRVMPSRGLIANLTSAQASTQLHELIDRSSIAGSYGRGRTA